MSPTLLHADKAGGIVDPIRDHPDFEHLEMKGMEVIKCLAARQSAEEEAATGEVTY